MLRSGEKTDIQPKSLDLTKIDLAKNKLDLNVVNLNYNIQNSLDIRKEVNNIFIKEGDHFEETNFNEFHTHYHFHSRESKPSIRNKRVSEEEIEEMISNIKTYDNEDLELPDEEENPDMSLLNGGFSSDPPGGKKTGKRGRKTDEIPDTQVHSGESEFQRLRDSRRRQYQKNVHQRVSSSFMDQKLLKREKKNRFVYSLTKKGENWIDWYEEKLQPPK